MRELSFAKTMSSISKMTLLVRVISTVVTSVCYTPEANITLYDNSLSIKNILKNLKKNIEWTL